MGEIAFANVVSDIYACGVINIDLVKVLLSIPTELEDSQQHEVVAGIIKGFQKSAKIANCKLEIQDIQVNPWCIIGGIATSVSLRNEIVHPTKSQAGDTLVLTKPLGVQLATNAKIWMEEESESWTKISEHLTKEDVLETHEKAVKSMTTLNLPAAKMMHKFGAHAATDITGFGLVGHAENLLKFQEQKLDFVINTLPVIRHVKKIAEILGRQQKLYNGRMVETSGGLLISLPADKAQNFCDDFETESGECCWIVGRVESGDGKVRMEQVQIVEV